MLERKACWGCGKMFLPKNNKQILCGDIECTRKRKRYNENNWHRSFEGKRKMALWKEKQYWRKPENENPFNVWVPKKSTLSENAKKARELGISYGQYVGLKYQEAHW